MTSSSHSGGPDPWEPPPTEAELSAGGWKRGCIADEPRISELVETYDEIGFDVLLVPVPLDDMECTECIAQNPDRFRILYTRKREAEEDLEPA